MATLDADQALDMEVFIAESSLDSFFEDAEAITKTGTQFVLRGIFDGLTETLALSGTFGNYVGDYPTTGTVTAIDYSITAGVSFTITNVSISVTDFTTFITANNISGLFEAILGDNDMLFGSNDGDVLFGLDGNDVMNGRAGVDVLYGGDGSDELEGGSSGDTMAGGAGNDIYSVDHAGDNVVEGIGEGTDTVLSSVDYDLTGRNVEILMLLGATPLKATGDDLSQTMNGNIGTNLLRGMGGDDVLNGGDGDDTLEGGAGIDTLAGGAGNDTIIGGGGADVLLHGGEGIDTLSYADSTTGTWIRLEGFGAQAGTQYVFGGDAQGDVLFGLSFENATGGSGDDDIIGSSIENLLQGEGGNDTLNGYLGNDTLIGGLGNDTIVGGKGGDTLDGGDGIDTLSYVGSSTSVFVRLFNNSVFGGDANGDTVAGFENVLGSSNNDDFIGSAGANVLDGALGNDKLQGLAGDDTLLGGKGGDTLDGGDGIDTLSYAGSSLAVYVRLFNNSVFGGDANGDTVAGFENVLGSSNNDDLIGSAGANVLDGALGNDVIRGLAGADILVGGDGVDMLDYTGSASAVFVRLFNNTTFGGDAAGDTIAGFENVLGSSSNDDLIGSIGANMLDGALGNDMIQGFGGDDAINGGRGGDVLDGGDGVDTLSYSSSFAGVFVRLFNDTAFGGDASGDTITGFESVLGSSFADDLIGSSAANLLNGGDGSDKLQGLGGNDVFRFTTALGVGIIDTIVDYSVADDTIQIENAVFTGLAAGSLTGGAFRIGATAADADDRIIYNSATGALLFDADGSGVGAAMQFATLSAALAMTAGEFVVI